MIAGKKWSQWQAIALRRDWLLKRFGNSGKQVDVLGELVDRCSKLRSVFGVSNQSKDVVALREETKFLAKPVIAKLFAVVGSNDDHGVIPHVHLYERVPHSA